MSSEHTLHLFFSVLESVRGMLPHAREEIKSYGVNFTLNGPRRDRIHSICQVYIKREEVHIGIIRGHLMPPHPRLVPGINQYKRHIALRSPSDLDSEVARMVKAAEALAHRSMKEFR